MSEDEFPMGSIKLVEFVRNRAYELCKTSKANGRTEVLYTSEDMFTLKNLKSKYKNSSHVLYFIRPQIVKVK